MPEPTSPDRDAKRVEGEYLATLEKLDRMAVRRRRGYLILRWVSFLASWGTILLAGAALANPQWGVAARAEFLVPFSGIIVVACTLLLFLGSFRDSWVACRLAAEKMRQDWVAYQYGTGGFGGSQGVKKLERTLLRAKKHVWTSLQRRVVQRLAAYPAILRSSVVSWEAVPPQLAPGAPAALLLSQILHQRAWHLRKARKNMRQFLLLQLAILAFSGAGVVLSWKFGAGFALVLLVNLPSQVLIFVRELTDLPEHYFHSFAVAQRLDAVGFAYLVEEAPFQKLDDAQRTKKLAEEFLSILKRGFRDWYMRVGNPADLDEFDEADAANGSDNKDA